jgi:Family of unknown function (DUF6502)
MDAAISRAQAALDAALVRIFRALACIALRHGMSFAAFAELAKRAFVDAARHEFALPGRKASTSRVALLTGLTRKDVQRLSEETPSETDDSGAQYNRAAKVIAGWVRDSAFQTGTGTPADLPFDGGNKSFSELVRLYSGDVPPRAVLDELLRVGAVERSAIGEIQLRTRVYIPRVSDREKLQILGTDVADLIATIDNNLQPDRHRPRFQRKVMYDNLPSEAAEKFRELSAAESQELIEHMDAWLSRHDRDANPLAHGSGRVRAGIGIYYFEEDLERPRE